MKMWIERPRWSELFPKQGVLYFTMLDKWFDENVEPINEILEKGVMAKCYTVLGDDNIWHADPNNEADPKKFKLSGLLINIQQTDTVDNVLRDILKLPEAEDKSHYLFEYAQRARKLLEKK